MLVKNVSQTVSVPVSFLMKDLNTLPPEAKAKLIDYARRVSDNAPNLDQEKEAARAVLTEPMRKELDALGCDMPIDAVELSMALGDFLYHVYAVHTKKPESPLAIKRMEKRLQDLAVLFGLESFEVPADVISVVTSVLEDDKKWAASQFGATVTVKDQQKYIGLTSHGAKMFTKVIDEAVSVCLSAEAAS